MYVYVYVYVCSVYCMFMCMYATIKLAMIVHTKTLEVLVGL